MATARPDDAYTDAPLAPSRLLGGLYEAVGTSGLFPRMKAFADAVPRAAPQVIVDAFRASPCMDKEQLAAFIDTWFSVPSDLPPDAGERPRLPLRAYIEACRPRSIARTGEAPAGSSLLPLPGRFITSGGMWREQYYWNTYFLMLGLGRGDADLREEMVDNIAGLIARFGYAPNANRSYYLGRSQPPLFFKMVALLDPDDEASAFARYLPYLMAEHRFWMAGEELVSPADADRRVVRLADGSVLNRYWDQFDAPRDEAYARDIGIAAASSRPANEVYRDIRAGAESGWDYSSRWFADRQNMASIATTSILPCDLNAYLFGLEQAIAAGCDRKGDTQMATAFRVRAKERAAAMNRHLWNDDLGIFDDYDWVEGTLRNAVSAAAFAPLFVGMASTIQAAATARRASHKLLVRGGIVSTDRHTGEQWDAPFGFAANQWIAISGLCATGHTELARQIAQAWLETVSRVYAGTGRLFEKYDLVDMQAGGGGGYPVQSGQGWTASVTLALLDRYPEFARLGETPPTDVGAPVA